LKEGKSAKHEGHWALKVLKTGTYQIEVMRWPAESGKAINEESGCWGVMFPGQAKHSGLRLGRSLVQNQRPCVERIRLYRPNQ
jgi:hypothetical protein